MIFSNVRSAFSRVPVNDPLPWIHKSSLAVFTPDQGTVLNKGGDRTNPITKTRHQSSKGRKFRKGPHRLAQSGKCPAVTLAQITGLAPVSTGRLTLFQVIVSIAAQIVPLCMLWEFQEQLVQLPSLLHSDELADRLAPDVAENAHGCN